MYCDKPGTKRDPQRRWSRPDRIFFGYGACHILAGVYLDRPPLPGFRAERIVPAGDFSGSHVYVTDGTLAFDHHGYSLRDNLLAHHARGWSGRHEGWGFTLEVVDFPLLSTDALNARGMRGPDQYLHDPRPRARDFIARTNHVRAASKALATR